MPPQALDAERAVLAALLLDPEAVGRAIELIDADVFYRVAHQRIFERSSRCTTATRRPTCHARRGAAQARRARGGRRARGARADVRRRARPSANLEQHIRIVHEKAMLRSLITAATRHPAGCYAGGDETPRSSTAPSSASSRSPTSACARASCRMRDLLKPTFEHIEELSERKALGHRRAVGLRRPRQDDRRLPARRPHDRRRPSLDGEDGFALNIAENAAIRASATARCVASSRSK